MTEAYAAWRAATKFLFWSFIEFITGAIKARKEAQRELTAFNPKNAKELFAAGYAVFLWEIYWDDWRGYWLPSDRQASPAAPAFQVFSWDGVPWHRVTFQDAGAYEKREYRAVPLAYARKHLPYGGVVMKEAA